MSKLLYQGHGSYRITTNDGKVIYVDPYAGAGYDVPADLILVTHQHSDHNQLQLITQNTGCTVITNAEALAGGRHNSFSVNRIEIEAVEAANKNHDPQKCVGYIISLDGLKIYTSGDTSKLAMMDSLAAKKLDYAILCCDGVYNMDLKEAADCAKIIGAKHNIPVHMKPGELFDAARANSWTAPNRLILEPEQEITL